MYNILIKLINICIPLLVCIGLNGCTATRFEQRADVGDAPVFQGGTGKTAEAPIPMPVSEPQDRAGTAEIDNPLMQSPECSEDNPEAGIAQNVEDEAAKVGVEEPCEPTYDFPIVRNVQVDELLHYYTTGRGRRSFELWLERSGRYLPLMQQTFAAHGLPQDLAMLALIESGFNSNAHSWANAVGYWQFIESTGRMYGLENTWWRDERRDVEKATAQRLNT